MRSGNLTVAQMNAKLTAAQKHAEEAKIFYQRANFVERMEDLQTKVKRRRSNQSKFVNLSITNGNLYSIPE